jgi:HTH-type transcriptional regulator/antitoxin HigA
MNIAPIKTQRDYRRALKEIEGLMSAKRNTPEGDRLDVLATLVEAWEAGSLSPNGGVRGVYS